MARNDSTSSLISSATSRNMISQIASLTSTSIPTVHSSSDIEQENPPKSNISISKNDIPMTDIHEQQQTVISTPENDSQFNLLKNNKKKEYTYSSHRKFRQRQDSFPKSDIDDKYQFNKTTYCCAYCTIIIIGVTMSGWIGGFFEFITNGYNGCTNEYRGTLKCQIRYGSLNVTTHCINIFYRKTIPNHSPYICLCRFRNDIKSKYRDCEFLYANIQ